MPEPDEAIGPYHLIRRLGRGGFGEVWLADRRSSLLAVEVALKLPFPEAIDSTAVLNEAKLWLRASGHPNVVPVLGAEEHDGRIAIASEYIAGGSLADWLRSGAMPDAVDAMRVAEGILAGLCHLHSNGIVHRDLKPENVLLQSGVPRLTDFGLARTLTGENLTQNLAGSPRYMAPETFSGGYSAASDLWAAGVIVYEMLAGSPPFDRPDVMELITDIREGAPAPLLSTTPEHVRSAVERMLRKAPEERFTSAAEALDAIRGGDRPEAGAKRRIVAVAPAQSGSSSSAGWFVQLMGGLELRMGDAAVTEQPTRKSAALLARLAFAPGKPFRREALMEMLWRGATLEQQRNNMSVELHRLRSRLTLPGVPGKTVLSGVDVLRLDPRHVSSDTSAMQNLVQQARKADASDLLALLQEATSLYRPALLPDFDQEWVVGAREEMDRLYLEAAEKIVSELGRRGDHERAIETARELVEADRLAEARHGLLIFAYVQADRPCDALRCYEEMERLWARELGGSPGPRARKLGEEARRRCEAQPALPAARQGHNGPVLPQTFFAILGREAEVACVSDLLLQNGARLVTLTGAGGSGKTRLAIELAVRLAEQFAGAVWFVPLADLTDRAAVLDALRTTLAIRSSPTEDPMQLVCNALAGQPSLLVLDNFEHLAESDADLVDSLLQRVPSLSCLVTSRQSLQSAMESIFEVPPLPLPTMPPAESSKHTGNLERNACVQLFIQRARRARPDFSIGPENASAIVELTRRLDGIPLAIELAAAWARTLTPAEMLGQLRDILVSRDRSVPTRHRSLDSVIEASFARLTEAQQRFLAQLSVFRGGWTADAARQVCAESRALLMLGELQDASLLLSYESGSTMRFRMLEPIREFAHERLAASNKIDGLQASYIEFFLDLAKQASTGLRGPEQAEWMRRLEDELPNLRMVLTAASMEKRLQAAAGLQRFWVARGLIREGNGWVEPALGALDTIDERSRASVLLAAGIMSWLGGDSARARSHLRASVAYCRATNDDQGVVKALANLATIAGQERDFETAKREHEACVAAARRLNDPRLTATVLGNLGTLQAVTRDLASARKYIEEALTLHEQFDGALHKADLLHNLADIEQDEGRTTRALQLLHESLTIRQRYGERAQLPQVLRLLGDISLSLHDSESCVQMMAAADRIRRDSGMAGPVQQSERWAATLAKARKSLAGDAFQTAWNDGLELSANEAVEQAVRLASTLLRSEGAKDPAKARL